MPHRKDSAMLPYRREYTYDMSTTVPTSTARDDPLIISRTLPFDAEVNGVTIGWLAGANGDVGVQIRTSNGDKLLPRNPESEYMASNDFTETFPLRVRLAADTEIEAVYVNQDDTNGHYMNVMPRIIEQAEGGR